MRCLTSKPLYLLVGASSLLAPGLRAQMNAAQSMMFSSMSQRAHMQPLIDATESGEVGAKKSKQFRISDLVSAPVAPAPAPVSPAPAKTRESNDFFSIDCPPNWSAQLDPDSMLLTATNNAVYMHHSVTPPGKAQVPLGSFARRTIEYWAGESKLQLSQQVELTNYQTAYGPGALAQFSYPVPGADATNVMRFLFIKRDKGFFSFWVEGPVDDKTVMSAADRVFKSVKFK